MNSFEIEALRARIEYLEEMARGDRLSNLIAYVSLVGLILVVGFAK